MVLDKLTDFGNKIKQARISYNPLTTNSNAFAHQAVTVFGINRPSAAAWAPGSGTVLSY